MQEVRQVDSDCVRINHPSGSVKQRTLDAALANAGLHDVREIRGSIVVFDFRQTTWFDLGALLTLVSTLYFLRRQANITTLQLPVSSYPGDTQDKLWSFLIRWGFFDALRECVDDPVNLLAPEQVGRLLEEPHYRFPTRDYGEGVSHSLRLLEIATLRGEDDDVASVLRTFMKRYDGDIAAKALAHMCGWPAKDAQDFIERVIRESVTNAVVHCEGGFSNVALRTEGTNLSLSVADNGPGIPAMLRQHRDKLRDEPSDAELIEYFTREDFVLEWADSQLMLYATQAGITTSETRKGLGLHYLRDYVAARGGELRIRSGYGQVVFEPGKRPNLQDKLPYVPGTSVRVQVPTAKPAGAA